MHVVEYLDPKTKEPTGQYAKRFKDPKTGSERDELIPKKIFCVCDAVGNIKSITEVNFSYTVEVEGKPHCFELESGEECHQILDLDLPAVPANRKNDKLKWLLNNHTMGLKDSFGKRVLKIKKRA